MRVAQLLPNMAIGGRERMVAELCQHLPDLDIETELICYDPPAAATAQVEHDLRVTQLDRKSPDFTLALARACKRFDVVHAQGHIPAHYLHQCRHNGAKLATLHINMKGTWRWLWPVRKGLRAMDQVVAVSRPMAMLYSAIAGRGVERIANGIDLSRFTQHRAQMPRQNEPFRFVMLSRLHKVKRHQDAVQAMDMLVANGINAELIIAGEGDLYGDLAALAKTRPYIMLAGAITDVPAFLAAHHALILCSASEGMPMVILEAMAAGLPVIASDVSDISSMLGGAGFLVPSKNPRALAHAMRDLIGNSRRWSASASSGQDNAKNFDARVMAQQYAGLYRSLLA